MSRLPCAWPGPIQSQESQRKFFNFCLQLRQLHPSGSPCPAGNFSGEIWPPFDYQGLFVSRPRSSCWAGVSDTLQNCLLLQRVVRGTKRSQGSPSSNRLPITDSHMLLIWNPWTYTSRITACFGRHALWGSLVSSAPPSLQYPIWPPSLLQFTWLLSRILQWMARRHLLVYVSQSRLQRLPLLLGVWFAYWFGQPSALCGASYDGLSLPAWECSRFSFNAAIRLSSISCAAHWLALAAVLRCWNIWKLFQPQFPHRRCNGCRL